MNNPLSLLIFGVDLLISIASLSFVVVVCEWPVVSFSIEFQSIEWVGFSTICCDNADFKFDLSTESLCSFILISSGRPIVSGKSEPRVLWNWHGLRLFGQVQVINLWFWLRFFSGYNGIYLFSAFIFWHFHTTIKIFFSVVF